MLRQWQSTVPLSIEINWNLKLKIATWPYNARHSPTRTSRTGSWSSNQTNPVTLETRSVQRSKLSHGRGDLDWQPNETFYLWSTCIFCSHMRETRKSSAMPTCQCWVDSFILLLQYWYWNYLELFGRDMILWYNSMILHDEIYWIHVEMVGHGTFACLERCASRLKSNLCSMLSVRDTPVSTQRDVKIFPILCHFCVAFMCTPLCKELRFNFIGEAWQPGKIHGCSTLRIRVDDIQVKIVLLSRLIDR